MPFRAECAFCRHRVKAPDHAVGASVKCPKCANFFTLVPEDDAPRRPEPARPAAVVAPAPEPVPLPDEPAPAPATQTMELPVAAPPSAWRQIDPVAVVALLLGGAALLCATVYVLCVLVRPLSGLGLLVGLAAVGLALLADPPRLAWPAAGSAVSGAVFAVALLFPGLLGPTYRASREGPPEDPAAIRAVPLAGLPATADLGDRDWPDASRAAVLQGPRRVQVVGVTVGPVEVQTTPKRKFSKEPYLVVRLRAQHVGGPREFAAGEWAAAGHRDRPAPTVTDRSGKVYRPAALPAVEAGGPRESDVFPVAVGDDVFLFEPPPPTVDGLRLEVPAAAWGGLGAYRFTVPRSMIQFAPAGPARPAPRPAG